MGWPSKLTDRELKRDSLLISCTSPIENVITVLFFQMDIQADMMKDANEIRIKYFGKDSKGLLLVFLFFFDTLLVF